MYNLPYHKENDPHEVQAFINQYPFAFISGCDNQHRPVATQVPVLAYENAGKLTLVGHFMKNTDHHRVFLHNPHVLIVFSGHHTYVSGTWYSNPYTASTWNYMSVHIKGALRFVDEAGLEDIMRKTTLHFEGNNPRSTTVYDQLPADFRRWAMQAIVGFEVEAVELDTVFKLSQDRDVKSYDNIIEKLRTQDEHARVIATEMERRRDKLFGVSS